MDVIATAMIMDDLINCSWKNAKQVIYNDGLRSTAQRCDSARCFRYVCGNNNSLRLPVRERDLRYSSVSKAAAAA